jgi:hypothetical protein
MITALDHRIIPVPCSERSDRMTVRLLIKSIYKSFYRLSQKYTQKGQCAYQLNSAARLPDHCFLGKAISITYSACVSVALVTSMKSACAVLCHLWQVWLYHIFPHYLINGEIFRKMLLNIKCGLWKSAQCGPFQGDRQTDMMKLIVAFHNFASTTKNNVVFR